MLGFEQTAVMYFAALAGAALVALPARRGRVAGAALLCIVAVTLAARLLPLAAREWLGHLYLVLGYWIPALGAAAPSAGRFEAWLVTTDLRWRPRLDALPRWLAHAGEAAYLLCYPIVPAAFAVVWRLGDARDVDRFWIATLAAGFACYASLPWLAARPPRLLTSDAIALRLARLNAAVLGRVSHGLTTFPSGHVAVAIAAALCVVPVSTAAAAIAGIVAAGIALGAAAGRYHYAIDVAAGAMVGVAAAGAATLIV